MTITYYRELIQGSEEWRAARCGLLTASEMKLIVKPTLKAASNDKERSHVYELAAQRLTRYVEPSYISDDMLRGIEDEILARELYRDQYAEVEEVGFVTNDSFGFTLGCSPDGLVGDDGFIECKSRRQKFQFETIVECVEDNTIPVDYIMQVQTAFLVLDRKWCDFITYSGGMPMVTIRVHPDPVIQEAILNAALSFEDKVARKIAKYTDILLSKARLIPTERREIQEMHL